MKKKISKIITLTCMMLFMAMSLTACGQKECDYCGEMAECKKIQFVEGGKKLNLCADCEQGCIDALNEMYGVE